MTLAPPPAGVRRALELGAYLHMASALHALCGYPECAPPAAQPIGGMVLARNPSPTSCFGSPHA